MKIIIIIALAFLAYNGYDGLRGSSDLVEYSADEIENKGIGDNRYIKIKNGYSIGQFVYNYSKDLPQKASSVIFPLISEEKVNQFVNGKSDITIKILIKRNTARFNSDCLRDTSCVNDIMEKQVKNGFSIKGVTQIGLNDVDDETKRLLSESGFNIDNKVVFLEEDAEPQGATKSILMLIGGILGLIIVVRTYFKSEKNQITKFEGIKEVNQSIN